MSPTVAETFSDNFFKSSQDQHIKPGWDMVLVLGSAGKMHRALMAAGPEGAWVGGFQLLVKRL